MPCRLGRAEFTRPVLSMVGRLFLREHLWTSHICSSVSGLRLSEPRLPAPPSRKRRGRRPAKKSPWWEHSSRTEVSVCFHTSTFVEPEPYAGVALGDGAYDCGSVRTWASWPHFSSFFFIYGFAGERARLTSGRKRSPYRRHLGRTFFFRTCSLARCIGVTAA